MSGIFITQAQNLVPNPSFEDTLNCPANQDEVYNAPPWFRPTIGTSDYFNQCYSGGLTNVDVPGNFEGYQFARTGNAYTGIACAGYVFFPDNRREYIEARLIDSLIAGKKYYIEFYVSLSDSSIWAIDFIGAYLSKDSVYDYTTLDTLPFIPQIENPAYNKITDKINWTKISEFYTAQGGEKFIVIGNFRGAASTHADTLSGTWYNAYYYIDDVSVIDSNDVGINEYQENNYINIYPNPCNGIFQVAIDSDTYSLEIYNVLGKTIYHSEINKQKTEIDISNESKGIYLLKILTDKEITIRKIILR